MNRIGSVTSNEQAMPIAVFVLFYSAVPCIDSTFIGILFQRQLAVPPLLLLDKEAKKRYAEDGYLHEKLTKASRGLRAYEQVRDKTLDTIGFVGMNGFCCLTVGRNFRRNGNHRNAFGEVVLTTQYPEIQ